MGFRCMRFSHRFLATMKKKNENTAGSPSTEPSLRAAEAAAKGSPSDASPLVLVKALTLLTANPQDLQTSYPPQTLLQGSIGSPTRIYTMSPH